MKTIAVDAMGGDFAPRTEVEGAVAAARTGQVRVVLVGRQPAIETELRRLGIAPSGRPVWGGPALPIELRHTEDVITMDDAPGAAVRKKRSASMRVAAELVAHGEADALVSAGNSGAMLACGLLVLRRLPGVDRPGILATLPTRRGDAVLLDTGANVACTPRHMVQYAVMGACYATEILGRAPARVGVLANGAEAHKGTELTRETDRLLREAELSFDYVGYVEGRDLFAGEVDVVVCDGFSGNLVLKVSEGAAETIAAFARRELTRTLARRLLALPLAPVLRSLRRRVDYAERGGAPLLGVRGTAIICHGGSNAKALMNGILAGARHADRGLDDALARWLQEHQALRNQTNDLDEPGGRGLGEGQNDDDTSEDCRDRPGGLRAGAHQRRSRAHGGHQRRVDHRAHRNQRAAHP